MATPELRIAELHITKYSSSLCMRRLQSTPEKLREELSKLLRRLEYGDVM